MPKWDKGAQQQQLTRFKGEEEQFMAAQTERLDLQDVDPGALSVTCDRSRWDHYLLWDAMQRE